MTNHILIKNKLNNFDKKIQVSADKSISIRSVLLASQAVGTSKISNLLESEDVLHSLRVISVLHLNVLLFSLSYLSIFILMTIFFKNSIFLFLTISIFVFNLVLLFVKGKNNIKELSKWQSFIKNKKILN